MAGPGAGDRARRARHPFQRSDGRQQRSDVPCRRGGVAVALLRQVITDGLLAGPFAEVRAKGLDAHIPVMCDFWESVLFRAGLYHGSTLPAHRHVHNRNPLSANHFLRWLALWNATVADVLGACRRNTQKSRRPESRGRRTDA